MLKKIIETKCSKAERESEEISSLFERVQRVQLEPKHITRGVTDAEIRERVQEYKRQQQREMRKAARQPRTFFQKLFDSSSERGS